MRTPSAVLITALLLMGALAWRLYPASAQAARPLPPPAADEAPGPATSEVAVLAGGCFWGVQGVFQHVKGVTNAVSGYAGGSKSTADYETVSTGSTGHAESVQITFDPRQISYGRLLQIFFSVAHDPTELNRQGPDVGTQYRSALFYTSDAQRQATQAYIAQLATKQKVVTQVAPLRGFTVAEAYHQDYATRHPDEAYIRYNDAPKVAALRQQQPQLWSDKLAAH